jgi:hypothetical protein
MEKKHLQLVGANVLLSIITTLLGTAIGIPEYFNNTFETK